MSRHGAEKNLCVKLHFR